ncbi:MAG: hypothetical protein RL619_804 [Bacteroidota bacterium]
MVQIKKHLQIEFRKCLTIKVDPPGLEPVPIVIGIAIGTLIIRYYTFVEV